MTTEQKQVVNDLWDLWEKLAEHGEIYIGKNFCKTYDLLKEQVKAINYNQCCETLPTDEEIYSEACNYVRQIKRPNNMPNIKLRQAFKNGAKFILNTLNKN